MIFEYIVYSSRLGEVGQSERRLGGISTCYRYELTKRGGVNQLV
jgi:hypothetical protein